MFAIILGLTLGLILAFGLYQANKTGNRAPNKTTSSAQPTPTATSSANTFLNVVLPQDGQIYNTATATVSGSTHPDNILVIISENDELFVKPQPDGTFRSEINLSSGLNNIQIQAISPQGDKQDVKLKVVFTTAIKVEDKL